MKTFTALTMFALLALPVHSQVGTTGVPGINDFTVNGLGSGSTSCTTLSLGCPNVLTFSVSAAPGTVISIFASPCKCVGCAFWLPPVTCLIPFTVGPTCTYNLWGGPSNQSIDLPLACGVFPLVTGVANGSGILTLAIPIPPGVCGFCFSAQAVIVGGCAPFLLSQAYDIVI